MSGREEDFKFFRSLADRYERLVKKLDATIVKAIILLEKVNQNAQFSNNKDLQATVGLLDEAVFQLHVWASDMTYQNFVSKEKLAMRELNAHDILNIIDASQMPIVGNLQRTFEQMEKSCLIFSSTLESMMNFGKDEWASHCATLDKEAGSITQAFQELDNYKSKIREQVNRTTAEDMERGLLDDNLLLGKASVLSIDGGGVRSYSSILIIRALMEEVRLILKDESPGVIATDARPNDVFEYIFGSSSGGLIAIMLGRLKMSEDQCLESFQRYADDIFGRPRLWLFDRMPILRRSPKYSSNNINRAIKMVIGNFDPSPDSPKWKRNLFEVPGERCKTGVTAYALQEGRASTHIFRTYSQSSDSEKSLPTPVTNLQIWEAARATSAAPFYFHPMTLGQTSFIDGGFGTNNPTREALREIQASRKGISPSIHLPKILVISVGSGLRLQGPVSGSSNPRSSVTVAAESLITDTEATHREMEFLSETQGIDYFRFAVDSGLSDLSVDSWRVRVKDGKKVFDTVEVITTATTKYLKRTNVVEQLHQCARLLVDRSRSNPFSSQPASSLSTIPFPRDPDFIGREEVLERVKEAFQSHSHVALVGLGGIGKTCVAIEYGYRHQIRHPDTSIFWIYAGTSSSFEGSLRSIAGVLKIPDRSEAKASVFQVVYNWLRYRARDGWLIILDNFEDEDILHHAFGLLPQNPKGQILITSRDQTTALRPSGSYGSVIEIGGMSTSESIDLFFKRFSGNCARSDAQELTQILGCRPLAINSVAGYLTRRAPRLTIRKFIDMYQEEQERLLSTDTPRDFARHQYSLGSVWKVTFEEIQVRKPSTWRLFCLMSLCGPDDIPDYLVHEYQGSGSDGPTKPMDLDFEDDISTLISYSLIKVNSEGNLFSTHRLIQSEMRNWLETSQQLTEWKQKYLVIIAKLFPEDIYDDWLRCKTLFTHASLALAYRPADFPHLHHWMTILGRVARYSEAAGDHVRAERLSIQALVESKKLFGEEDPKTLETMAYLAMLYARSGRYEDAKLLGRQALAGGEKAVGPEDLAAMTRQDSVALVLLRIGDYQTAEEIFTRGLETRRKVLGEQHPDTLTSLHRLGMVFHKQGKLQEAESLFQQAVVGLEKTLESEDPRTLIVISDLASIRLEQGEVDAAEDLVRRAHEGLEKVLGKQHPDTLNSAKLLALILDRRSKDDAAKATYVLTGTSATTVKESATQQAPMVSHRLETRSRTVDSEAQKWSE